MDFNYIKIFFCWNIEKYIPGILKSNKTVSQIVSKINNRYKRPEIVEYFKTFDNNEFLFLTPGGELFIHGNLMMCFDSWLTTMINLMIFSSAHDTYEKCIDKDWTREQQIYCTDNLLKGKFISREQYLYIIEIINCMTGTWQEKL